MVYIEEKPIRDKMFIFDYIVYETPMKEVEKVENAYMDNSDLAAIDYLVMGHNYPSENAPRRDFFTDVRATIWKGLYREYENNILHRAHIFFTGAKIVPVYDLRLNWGGIRLKPFDAHRIVNGIEVSFINETPHFKEYMEPYCKAICITHGGYQCARWGSYSQIELGFFMPVWDRPCNNDSARNCPILNSKVMPKPNPNDETIMAFTNWCKTRNKR